MTKDVKEVKSTSKWRGDKLKDKRQKFVEEYLIDLNATQAAIRAGYSEKTAKSIGQRLLTFVDVQKAIQEAQQKRSERVNITQDDVVRMLLENIEIASGRKEIIKTEIRKSENGELVGDDVAQFVYESSSVNKALELLGKHLGMFKDRVDITSGDNPLPTRINVVFGDDREDD